MKAVNCTWIATAIALLFLTSCTQNSHEVFDEAPGLQARADAQIKFNVTGMDGLYSTILDDCVPPNGNCFSTSKIAPGKVYSNDLDAAINGNDLNNFLNTENGKLFLRQLDVKVASDLIHGKTTIKKYFGRHFAVYQSAQNPYQGPDYGRNGLPIKSSDIPN